MKGGGGSGRRTLDLKSDPRKCPGGLRRVRRAKATEADLESVFDHKDGLRTQDQSAVCPEMPSLQMQLIVVALEFQDREVFTLVFTPTMMDAIRGLGIFEHFHEGGPVQMWLKGLGLHRGHVVDLLGRLALVFTLTGTEEKRSPHELEGCRPLRRGLRWHNLGRIQSEQCVRQGTAKLRLRIRCGAGFSGGHLEKFGVEGASIEGQLVGLQGWDFGGGAHGIDAILREIGTTDLRGRTRASILDAVRDFGQKRLYGTVSAGFAICGHGT